MPIAGKTGIMSFPNASHGKRRAGQRDHRKRGEEEELLLPVFIEKSIFGGKFSGWGG